MNRSIRIGSLVAVAAVPLAAFEIAGCGAGNDGSYRYAGDQKPGDANGQGITAFGDGWFALARTGNMISGTAPNADGTNGY